MISPPWIGDPSALVIVDWSWWLNKAFRIAEVDGMTSIVVGWLCDMLATEPAHVCLALDAGKSFRHAMQHPTDETWRYKGGRDPKPADFYTMSARITELAELHSIPTLWADGAEADDVIATVVTRARSAGFRVWIVTSDKDLAGLVESSPEGIAVGCFDGERITGPVEVQAKFGVHPRQIADYLAIAGDAGDNVPGVAGLGGDKASKLLTHYGTLEDALSVAPWSAARFDAAEVELKLISSALKSKKTPESERPVIAQLRADAMAMRTLAKWHLALHESADLARFSRSLTALDHDVAIDVPWYDLPIGGFKVDELRDRYTRLGFSRKAFEVPSFPKGPPWAIGEEVAA